MAVKKKPRKHKRKVSQDSKGRPVAKDGSSSGPTRRQLLKYGFYGGLALAAAGAGYCYWPRRKAPNVVFIVADTLRADHLGCYGYQRNTSPRIDALAENATFYLKAMASSPWTLPTHASLFTGRYSFEHGAHTFDLEKRGFYENPLHSRHLTLAEVFKKEGYRTAAFIANEAYLSTRWQLNRGFDTYHVERLFARQLNKRVVDWLDSLGDDRFFLFINYMDTHTPYNSRFRPGFINEPVAGVSNKPMKLLYDKIMPGQGPRPTDLIRAVINQYDTAIANLDEQIGVLIDHLIAKGLYDNTIIVLMSDHGEFFGEHYLVEHSKDVYQEVLWVPLIIRSPSQKEGKVVETLISSVDVPNLILSRLPHNKAEQYHKEFPYAPGNHVVLSENYYTRRKDLFHPVWGKRFNRVRTVIYDWPYKYISSSDEKHELYNIEHDRRESTNLIEQYPAIAYRLANKLQQFQGSRIRSSAIVEQPGLTQKEIQILKSLGYIGE